MDDSAHKKADATLAKMEKELDKLYKQGMSDMFKKQAAFMNEYAKAYPKMKKQLEDGDITEDHFKDWLRDQAMKERWFDEMTSTLASHAVKVDELAMGIINGYTPEIYAENYNWGTFSIEHGTGIDTMFTLYDKATVERLLRDNPKLIAKAGVDKAKDYTWNKRKFTSAIAQGILQGESMEGIQARLMNVMGMDENVAMRAARTATTAAENGGRIDSFKRAQDMGIEIKKTWIATLDGRTRHSHRVLDGVSIGIDETFENDCAYPGDPYAPGAEVYNCRCTLIADLADVDVKSGHRFKNLQGMTYEEWKAYEGKPVSAKRKEKAKEEAPKREMMRYTMNDLKELTHEELVQLAHDIFIRQHMEAGVPREEAEHRFWALIGSQSDSYLRRFINKNQ